MSNRFREFIQKIGSGPHTGENLNRQEAAEAMSMMLNQEATPAQIGAFLIAHRIKRPTGEELAGMLDAYEEIGPTLRLSGVKPMVFGCPYDGRSRMTPLVVITALILATVGQPAIMHGGDKMPTKYGVPLIDIWQGLGINWCTFSLQQVQQLIETTGLGFVYLPNHFPQAAGLVPYREQLGKRPPIATLELIWSPVVSDYHLIAGFVHPPTETLFQEALALRGVKNFTTIKGLEGSCDLPRDRTAIIGRIQNGEFQRLHRNPYDYDFGGKNPPIPETTPQLIHQMQRILEGKPSELMHSAIWNGGFYLWHCGFCPDIATGFDTAENLLSTGKVNAKLQEVMRINS
ncbi:MULTISPECIES: anthranilate phosphoribosyltransferase family protein [Planktothricoides]|uniref:Anthranilate phosphoribosyltransferase family protein n=2 Tax=Planktothricoides raciborskii TaxID=132608 RepID=A0AAU8JC85_9CYAN|nr:MULTISPECIES: anthranilate phosphoribosyltransferase family protein [Planktothricoides]KOR38008.1 hypothetical protein AM228_04310 [Planktothricoides sp. SR001]MBD2542870.1 anthranilate phosphoribosyltransferase family protein [Planktothricoides raciborskii FACHB-1370]MBD2581383.1 anthranilate phosphoribosyltransferase family protein [Planktothricoides raciborskii FACHB-1261]